MSEAVNAMVVWEGVRLLDGSRFAAFVRLVTGDTTIVTSSDVTSQMQVLLNVPYSLEGRNRQRELDVYIPDTSCNSPLLVFVHGGAWISGDKGDHADLARRIATITGYAVAVPNYTLTPRDPPAEHSLRHPIHAEDVLLSLKFLRDWRGPDNVDRLYDPDALYLVGHSCSAHILSSIFLDSSGVTPSLTPPSDLALSVKAIILSEGLYDLDLLLDSFPGYRKWFVIPAFGPRQSYASFSPTNFSSLFHHIRWLLIHSSGDSLVDLKQSIRMRDHLASHVEEHVHTNFHELTANHDDIFTDHYVHIISNFIHNNT